MPVGAPVYPSGSNTFVRSIDATNKLTIDFARNPNKFAVNQYCQIIPVKKVAGYYIQMTIEEAGRIISADLSNFAWPDGNDAPTGEDGTESFNFMPYQCQRRAFAVRMGDLTIEQADWNILAQHSSIKARQAMTARTQLAVTALTTTGNYDASHVLTVGAISGNSGKMTESTTARQDIKRSLNTGAELILDATLAAIELDDLLFVISSGMAALLAETQEIVDHIKGSPEALAQIRGELPGRNAMYGLPDKLYGFPVVVEKTRKVTSRKGATRAVSAILPDATPFLCARPGGLVGVADSPNFATCCFFALEEMTVESKRDPDNRRTVARVVENIDARIVAPASGVLFQGAA